jgi:hypothetical protein
VSSVPPSQQEERRGKKLSGFPLFLIRFVLFFIVLAAASSLFELLLSFVGHRIGLLIVILPLGWAAAMVLSAWLVGMLYYGKDDTDGE